MDNVEIILKNVARKNIEKVFFNSLVFDIKNIISSHFFDKEKNVDMEYQNVKSLNKYFDTSGAGNLYLKKVIRGTELANVLILIGCDEKYGDITINFEEEQFENFSIQEIKGKLKNLIMFLLNIYRNNEIEEITIGYEPAYDEDRKIIEIRQSKVMIFNEGTFKSPIALILYSISKNIMTQVWS